jgi:hypothetical protein
MVSIDCSFECPYSSTNKSFLACCLATELGAFLPLNYVHYYCCPIYVQHTWNIVLQDIIRLDDVQYDYLLALMGSYPEAVKLKLEERGVSLPLSSLREPTSAAGSSSSAADPVLVGLIAQIRDMLPEYGTGFLTACLQHYDLKSEQVWQSNSL